MNLNSHSRIRTIASALFGTGGFLLTLASPAPHASAQTPAAAPSPAGPYYRDADDSIVEMSPFVVSDSAYARTYAPSESLTGTRVATKIQDLPFTVNVLTSEFMMDFDILDASGLDMSFASSLTDVDAQGNYTLRGIGGTFTLRDGFYRLGLNDRVNIDRIEVIKGPNAAIYGQTTPSGMINYISKRPKNENSQRLLVGAGSDNLFRTELNINNRLNAKGTLLNLLSVGGSLLDGYTEFGKNKRYTISDAFTWKISGNTRINVQAEWNKRLVTSDATGTVFENIKNPLDRNLSTVDRRLSTVSQRGGDNWQNRELSAGSVNLDHRFNEIFSARISAYGYARHAPQYNQTYKDLAVTNGYSAVVKRSAPVVDVLDEWGGAVQGDILARVKFAGGRAVSSTLLTFDYGYNRRTRTTKEAADSTLAALGYSTSINLDTPNYLTPDPSLCIVPTRDDDTSSTIRGIFLREQLILLENRLHIYGGVRYDNVKFNMVYGAQYDTGTFDPAKPLSQNPYKVASDGNPLPGQSGPDATKYHGLHQVFSDSAVSPSAGINYKYTKNIALFVNYSKSFYPNAQSSKYGDPILKNETAEGYDYGIKASFADDRLVFTISGYYIDRDGVKISSKDAGSNEPDALTGGKVNTKGWEFDGTWSPAQSLTFQAYYGYNNATITNKGLDTDAVGRRPQGLMSDNGGFVVKYSFPGALKGLSANYKIVYQGTSFPESTGTTIAARDWRVPGYAVSKFSIGYRFKAPAKWSHSVRLTIDNIFDREYIDARGNYRGPETNDGRAFIITYTLNH